MGGIEEVGIEAYGSHHRLANEFVGWFSLEVAA